MQAWNNWGQQATQGAVGSFPTSQAYQAGQVYQSGQIPQVYPAGQVAQAYTGTQVAQAYPGAQLPAQQMMTNYQQFYGAAVPAATGEIPAGYTAQQWEAAQQQHYMQWQQWNQQFQQWQQEYGNTYSMAVQGGVPTVPPPSTTAEPPPLPPPDKPPPPPDETRSQQLEAPNFQVPPPDSAPGYQGQKRPPSDNDQSSYQGSADKKQRSDNFEQFGQGSGGRWGATTEGSVKPEEEEDRSEQEKSFDAQFLLWEEEFKNWKDQNINHPDKTQYNEYETKWTKWRQELLQRREQMRKKRLASMAKTSPGAAGGKTRPKMDQPPRNQGNDFKDKNKPLEGFGNDLSYRGGSTGNPKPVGAFPTNGKPEIKSLLDLPLQFTGPYQKKGYGPDRPEQNVDNSQPSDSGSFTDPKSQAPLGQQADPKGFSIPPPNNRGLPFDGPCNFQGLQQGKINFNFIKPGLGQQFNSGDKSSQPVFGPQPKPVGPSSDLDTDDSSKQDQQNLSGPLVADNKDKPVDKATGHALVDLTKESESTTFDFFKKSNVIPGLDLFSEKPSDSPAEGPSGDTKNDASVSGAQFGPRMQNSQEQGFEFSKGPNGGQGLMPTPSSMDDVNTNKRSNNDGAQQGARMNQGPGQPGSIPFGPHSLMGNTSNNQNPYANSGNQNKMFGPSNEGPHQSHGNPGQNYGSGNQGPYMNSINNGPNMGPGGQNPNFSPGNMGSNFTSPGHKGSNMGQGSQNQNFSSGAMGLNFTSPGNNSLNSGPISQHPGVSSGNMGPNQVPDMGVQPPPFGSMGPHMGRGNHSGQSLNFGSGGPNFGARDQRPMGLNFGTGNQNQNFGPGHQGPNFGPPDQTNRNNQAFGQNFGPKGGDQPGFMRGQQAQGHQENQNFPGSLFGNGARKWEDPEGKNQSSRDSFPGQGPSTWGDNNDNRPGQWSQGNTNRDNLQQGPPRDMNQGPRDSFPTRNIPDLRPGNKFLGGLMSQPPPKEGFPGDNQGGPMGGFTGRKDPPFNQGFPEGNRGNFQGETAEFDDPRDTQKDSPNGSGPRDHFQNNGAKFSGREGSGFQGPPREGFPKEGSNFPGRDGQGTFSGPPPPREGFSRECPSFPGRDGQGTFSGPPPREGFPKDCPNFPGRDGQGTFFGPPPREGFPKSPNFPGRDGQGTFSGAPPRDGFPKQSPNVPGRIGQGSFPGPQPREGLLKEGPNFSSGDGPDFSGQSREGFSKEGPNFSAGDGADFPGPPREGFAKESPNFLGSRDVFMDNGPNYRGLARDCLPGDREAPPRTKDNQGLLREPFPNDRFPHNVRGNPPRDLPLGRDRFDHPGGGRGGFPDRDTFRDDFRGREDHFRGDRIRDRPFDERENSFIAREHEVREYKFGHAREDTREPWDPRSGGRPPPRDYFRPTEQFGKRDGDGFQSWNRPNSQNWDNFQLEPATIVEYGHKPAPPAQLMKLESAKTTGKSLDLVQTFDYGHGTGPTRHIRDVPPEAPLEPRRREERYGQRDREFERDGRDGRWERGRREEDEKNSKYGQEEDRFRGRNADRWGRRGERDDDRDRNGRSRDKRDTDSGRGSRSGPPPPAPPPPSFSTSSDTGAGESGPGTAAAPAGPTQPAQRPILVEDLLSPPGRDSRPQRIVIILRGPPGSGKSFVAKLIKDKEVEMGGSAPRILCLDDYFMVEVEKEEQEAETGRKVKVKVMEFEYESGMEKNYRSSLVKAFKKTVNENYFPFIIVDCVNQEVKHFEEMWSYAKQKGFQVYICEMDMDVSSCMKRNTHNRTEKEIANIVKSWEETPKYYLRLDVRSLLQSVAITEVEMEDSLPNEEDAKAEENENKADEEANEPDEDIGASVSKWERMEPSGDKLDRLDGLKRRKGEEKPKTLEDWLQLSDDYDKREIKPGQKRVRWADLEEKREQEKMRAIGFVVGQTDWSRMTDPTFGESALTQTKYI